MFIGQYYHRLESGGRVSLPKSYRTQHSLDWIITRGLDGGLWLFTPETFTKEIGQVANRTFTKKAHRDFVRAMVNAAHSVTPDSVGRITIPDHLIQSAGFEKDLVIVGSYSHIELWNREAYHAYLEQLEPQIEALTETLDV